MSIMKDFYEKYNGKIEKLIDRLYNHLHKLEEKSEQLMIGDFKQYVDEEWIDEAYEIISNIEE